MPELPEVHTTATILNSLICNKKIVGVWTDYKSPHYTGKENIKDPLYFKKFKKEIVDKKIVRVWRRAKNVLIELEDNKTILIHMKMMPWYYKMHHQGEMKIIIQQNMENALYEINNIKTITS